jgi:hypothetical protein
MITDLNFRDNTIFMGNLVTRKNIKTVLTPRKFCAHQILPRKFWPRSRRVKIARSHTAEVFDRSSGVSLNDVYAQIHISERMVQRPSKVAFPIGRLNILSMKFTQVVQNDIGTVIFRFVWLFLLICVVYAMCESLNDMMTQYIFWRVCICVYDFWNMLSRENSNCISFWKGSAIFWIHSQYPV